MRTLPTIIVVVACIAAATVELPVTRGGEPSSQPVSSASSGGSTNAAKMMLAPSKITPDCRKSIDKGTQWLMAAIRRDGTVGPDIGQPPDLGCTAIVGLALMSQGTTPQGGTHQTTIKRIVHAVVQMIAKLPKGDDPARAQTLIQSKIGRNADFFLAALFLSQALGEGVDTDQDGTIRKTLERLVHIISRSQGKDGTWGDQSWAPILGTVLGWESLRASHSCGLKVEASAKAAGEALLGKLKNLAPDTGEWMHDFYKHASSIRVLYALDLDKEQAFKECVRRVLKSAREDPRVFKQAGGEEYLSFFLVTECMLQGQDESWKAWYPLVRDKLMEIQNADGSWTGHHCIRDRTFCTAAALLTLQAPDLNMPISGL